MSLARFRNLVEPQAKCASAQIGALRGNCGNYVAWLFLLAGSYFLSELVLTREVLVQRARISGGINLIGSGSLGLGVRWQILGRFKNWKSLNEGTRMFAVIDRIEETEAGPEGRLAVLAFDDGQRLTVPLANLPPGSREGLVLAVAWTIDTAETDRRRARVYALQHDVFGERTS